MGGKNRGEERKGEKEGEEAEGRKGRGEGRIEKDLDNLR